jgi:replicative DNA helicase
MKLTKVFRDRLSEIEEEHEVIKKGGPPPSMIPTKLREFDRRGGHKRKSTALYGADTGGGKSLWKYHLAWAAASSGFQVTIVDLEDPRERTADRGFARETGINSAKLLSGDLTDKDILNLRLALDDLEEWADNVEFFDGVKTGEEALSLFEEHPYDLGLLDYLSAFPHGKHGREREISDFMWGWTKLAQETNSANVAFAQVNERVTERGLARWENDQRWNREDGKKKPNVDAFRTYDTNDLAWCKDAGKNAKETGFMIRPGRILKRLGVADAKDDVMEFDFPKRNWGSEGRIRVGLDLKTARFFDLDTKDKNAKD